MSIRWHTDPQYENTPTQKQTELYDLVNLDSYEPLYLEIQKTIQNPPKNLSSEDLFWLKSIENAFDSYVTRVLNDIRMEPWDYEHRIRDEYTKIYTEPLPLKTSIRIVMGRLMTYKEIWSYAREAESRDTTSNRNCNSSDWFWRRPEPKPIWKREPRFISGIHPTQKNRVYHVTYEKPWNSSSRFAELDPNHNWGVFIDQTRSYTDDAYVRVLMACCAEPIGKTEGCWIALDEDKNAVEGIVKPYRVYHSAFDDIWADNSPLIKNELDKNSPLPQAKLDFIQKISNSSQIGTAFQDLEKYKTLHTSIKKALSEAAPVIQDALVRYKDTLQATLDKYEEAGDSMRDTNPFESILSKEQQDSVVLPLKLRDEFNAIQMLKELRDPKDFVNQNVFKVGDMLKYFTFDKMGGIVVTTGTGPARIKMLNSTQTDKKNIKELRRVIAKAKSDPLYTTYLSKIDTEAGKIIKVLESIEKEKDTIDNLKELDEYYQELKDAGINVTATKPPNLDWSKVQTDQIENAEKVKESIITKQNAINTSLRSLRTPNNRTVVSTDPLVDVSPLPPAVTPTLLAEFKENMQVAELVEDTKKVTVGRIPRLDSQTYKKIQGLKTPPTITNSTNTKVMKLKEVEAAKFNFENSISDVVSGLGKIEDEWFRLESLTTYINNSGKTEEVIERVSQLLELRNNYIALQPKIKAVETAREKIRNDYQTIIDIETKNYDTNQTVIKNNAIKTLSRSDFFKSPKNAKNFDAVEEEFKKLLNAVKPLDDLDEFTQLKLEINKLSSVGERLKKDRTEFQNVKNSRYLEPYVKVWNQNDGVLESVKKLADALKILLEDLTNKDESKRNSVAELLADIETKSQKASDLIASEEQRAKEEAERLEKERLEITRLRSLVDDQSFNKWMSQTSISSFISESSVGIKSLTNLWNDVKLKLTGVVFPSRFINQTSNTLAKRLIDDNAITDEIDVDNMRDLMYVEGLSLEEMKNAWILFRDTLIDTTTKLDELQKTTVAEQPTRAVKKIVDNQVNTPKSLVTFEKYETNGYSGLMTTKSLEWIENSCWIDTVMMSMFSIPQTEITKRIYNSTIIKTNAINLAFLKGPLKILGCKKEDAENIHTTLVNDIDYIQNPDVIPTSHTCSVRPFWDNLCGPKRVTRAGFGALDDVFGNLKQFYPDSFSYDTKSELLGNIYNDYIPYNAKPNHVWNIEDNLNYILDAQTNKSSFSFDDITTHKLVAVIYILYEKTSDSPHHYVTHILDFEANKWYHYDRNSLNQEKQMRELTPQEYIDKLDNRADYKYTFEGVDAKGNKKIETRDENRIPVCFIFFSDAEVTRLKAERSAFKKSVVAPSSLLLWNSDFQNLPRQEILKKIGSNFNTFIIDPNENDWAKKLGLFDEATDNLITDYNEISDDPILLYAYFHFYEWLSKIDTERPLSEIKMRKALAAAREIPNETDLNLLGIKRYPADLRKAQLIKRVLLEEVRKKKPPTPEYIKRRKLIFGTRFRINFSELEN
jgi:hypothetical protein